MENYLLVAFLIAIIWGVVPFFTKYVLHRIHYKSLILIESILAFLIAMTFCGCHRNDIMDDFKNVDTLSVIAIILIGLSVFSANIIVTITLTFIFIMILTVLQISNFSK